MNSLAAICGRRRLLTVCCCCAILLVAASACTSPPPAPPAAPAQHAASTPAAVHWTYHGQEGPEHWGALSKDFALCSNGTKQSPIDIVNRAPKDLPNIVFHYQASIPKIVNNGHTIQVSYDPGNSIEVDGEPYALVQFHFHAPSEHSVNGKLADAEVHLVHQNASGKLAVVGVLINKGAENALIKPVLDSLPNHEGPAQPLAAPFNPEGLVPMRQTTFRYEGSLTTPPCTEGVTWLVMTEPIQMSARQLAAFADLFKGNNRPVQPLNQRPVVEDTSP